MSSTAPLARELEILVAAARAAGRLVATAMRRHGTSWPVERKADGEPVTPLDREVDLLVRGMIEGELACPVVSEESLPGGSGPLRAADLLAAARTVIVDPLDGTAELLRGTGDVAVLVGLVSEARAVAGAVALPAERIVLGGARGLGAFAEAEGGARRRLAVSPRSQLEGCRLIVSRDHPPSFLPRLLDVARVAEPDRRGAVGVKLAMIALGRAEVYVHAGRPVRVWDTCAAEAVLAAAGGRLTDLGGDPIDYASGLTLEGGLVASNGALHDAWLAAVGAAAVSA